MTFPNWPRFELTDNLTRILVAWGVCLAMFVFGVFVWPTPYRYEKVNVHFPSDGSILQQRVYRINRFTSYCEVIIPKFPKSTED